MANPWMGTNNPPNTIGTLVARLHDWDWANAHGIEESGDDRTPFPVGVYSTDNGLYYVIIFQETRWEDDGDDGSEDQAYLPQEVDLDRPGDQNDDRDYNLYCRDLDENYSNWYYDRLIDLRHENTTLPIKNHPTITPLGLHQPEMFPYG